MSRALGHESVAITSRIYVHAIETLQDEAAARIDALLGEKVAGAFTFASGAPQKASVPQRCHKTSKTKEKPRKNGANMVATTGIEFVFRP